MCGLLEAGAQVLPHLAAAYDVESNPHVRAAIVRLASEHRKPYSVTLLARALNDPTGEVKKAALDGLVTVGGAEARQTLESALLTVNPRAEWAGWLREAISQLNAES
jgi:hypothetical protein